MTGTTLVDLLSVRAEEYPDRLQYRFLDDGSETTVGALHALARRVGAALRTEIGVRGRVVLLLPPGPGFVAGFFGTLFAGAIPVPVAPPGRARLTRGLGPVRSITADCSPDAVLTVAGLRDLVLDSLGPDDSLLTPAWLAVEDLARATRWCDDRRMPSPTCSTPRARRRDPGGSGSPTRPSTPISASSAPRSSTAPPTTA